MTYDFSTVCAIAKVLGFPEVEDGRVQALLWEGRRRRWRRAEYEKRYTEVIENAISLGLTWSDYEEFAIVCLVRLREREVEKQISAKIMARNRAIELLKREQYDEAQKQIDRVKEIVDTIALMTADIANIQSQYPNADWTLLD